MKSVFSMVIENVALFIISLRSLFDVFVIELSLIFHVVLMRKYGLKKCLVI